MGKTNSLRQQKSLYRAQLPIKTADRKRFRANPIQRLASAGMLYNGISPENLLS